MSPCRDPCSSRRNHASFDAEPNGLVFGPGGRLYANLGHHVVVVSEPGGTATDLPADDLLNSGGDGYLAFDSAGHLCATSNATGQVVEFDATTGAELFTFDSVGVNGIGPRRFIRSPGTVQLGARRLWADRRLGARDEIAGRARSLASEALPVQDDSDRRGRRILCERIGQESTSVRRHVVNVTAIQHS